MKEEFTNYLAWILELSRKDKLSSGGKHTQLILYSDNRVQLNLKPF
jgi:hypothetical protein